MPRASRASALIFLLMSHVSAARSQAQQQPATPATETEQSYRRARAVLDAAARALAGDKPLPGMDAVSFKITGKLYHRNQSLRADGPPDATPFAGEVAVDFPRNWMVFERSSSFPGGFDFSNRWVRKGEEATNYNLLRKQHSPTQNSGVFFENVALRRLPQHHVKTAQERATSLRWVGEAEFNGTKHNVVSYATAAGGVVTLYFDAQTNLLSKFETLTSDALFGDVVAETSFTGYQTVGGIPLPTGQVDKRGGVLTLDVSFSGHTVAPLPESAFAPLPGFTAAAQAPAAQPAVRELAKDVYLVEGLGGGGYRVLFVSMRDFVMVAEAPLNEETTETVLRLIRETVPSKPIRFVAITHHHDDHSGGLRGYMAEGITLVTTPGNINFLRSVMRAPFTIRPDGYARSGRRGGPVDLVENGKAVFTDGVRTLELLDIGPGPHAQEMLVVWLPQEKILFQGDLLNRAVGGSLQAANDTTAHFYEWLKRSGLPVEKLIGVHSQASAMADLETTMEMRRQRLCR